MKPKKQGGFALLISLIVVGVVISVGLTVLELSITQVRLSDNAKQSELAFHAANAGVECGRFWRRTASTTMLAGGSLSNVECFDEVNPTVTQVPLGSGSDDGEIEDGTAYRYDYSFSWGAQPRCTEITTIIIQADPAQSGATLHGVATAVPGFPVAASADAECGVGEQCTIMAVRGYNQSCGNIGNFGTTQREVLLQF